MREAEAKSSVVKYDSMELAKLISYILHMKRSEDGGLEYLLMKCQIFCCLNQI